MNHNSVTLSFMAVYTRARMDPSEAVIDGYNLQNSNWARGNKSLHYEVVALMMVSVSLKE